MSYTRKTYLPKTLDKLPNEAKEIYSKAFNNAEKFYAKQKDKELIATRVAWNAVKKKIKKVKDSWIKNNLISY